jgi:hypothetical protein
VATLRVTSPLPPVLVQEAAERITPVHTTSADLADDVRVGGMLAICLLDTGRTGSLLYRDGGRRESSPRLQ